MKLGTSPKLRRDCLDEFTDGSGFVLCAEALAEVFHLPRRATHVQIVAYDRPGKGLVPVKFSCDGLSGEWFIRITDTDCMFWLAPRKARYIASKVNGEFYIELYYWD